MAQATPKKWFIYALIALGFAGLILAHEFAPPDPSDNIRVAVTFIFAAVGTLSFVVAGVMAFRILKRDGMR